MSSITLNENGSVDIMLSNQTELDDADRQRILPLEQKSAQLSTVEVNFKETIKSLEIKLLDNPDFSKLMKLRGKQQQVRKMKRELSIILANEYKLLFKKQGVSSEELSDIYSDLLPEEKVIGKRGRPRKEIGSHV